MNKLRTVTLRSESPRRADIDITEEQRASIDAIVQHFLHVPLSAADYGLNMLKLVPHLEPSQRDEHLASLVRELAAEATPHRSASSLPDDFEDGLRMTATYLNLDADTLVALARRGRTPRGDN